jgi:DNA repair protein RadC
MTENDSTEGVEIHRATPQLKVIVVGDCAREEDPKYLVDSPERVESLPMIRDLMRSADRETFACLHLNTKNHLLSWEVVAIGSLNTSVVHPRELFKAAVLANAASVVLVHNHPSGDPTPSGADLALTRRLVRAGDVLGIEVLDHVIFGEDTCVSLRDRDLM